MEPRGGGAGFLAVPSESEVEVTTYSLLASGGGRGTFVGLNSQPVGSDAVSRWAVSN